MTTPTTITYKLPNRFLIKVPMKINKPQWIIIHHTKCNEKDFVNVGTQLDTKKYQYTQIKKEEILDNKQYDVNFHYIVDKIGADYEIIVGRPLHYFCEYPDIPDIYKFSIHVGVMGDYNLEMSNKHLYQILSYRLLIPTCYWFRLDYNKVLFHNEISTDELCECPGAFMFKENLVGYMNRLTNSKRQ